MAAFRLKNGLFCRVLEWQMRFLGLGRAYMDVLAPIDEDFLIRFGLEKGIGMPVSPDVMEAIGRSLEQPQYLPGGNAANTLSALAAMGHPCGFWGAVGGDEAGKVFAKDLDQQGIEAHLARWPGVPNGVCYVLITPGGERSFAYHPGCSDALTRESGPQEFCGAYVLIEGLSLDIAANRALVGDFLRTLALQDAVRVIVSLQDIQTSEDLNLLADYILPRADIVIANEAETEHFAQALSSPGAMSNYREEAMQIVTCGAEGAALYRGRQRIHVPSIPIAPHDIVDTTGAGDHFLAGFLHSLDQSKDLETCLAFGHKCAAAIIAMPGGRPSADYRSRLSE